MVGETNSIGLIITAVKKFGFSQVEVRGKSMQPVLEDKTVVKIVKKKFREIRPTDWVAFKKNENLLVHEVLFKSKKYLVPWGVNNQWTDGAINPDQIIGVVDKKQLWRRWHLVYLGEAKAITNDLVKVGIKNLILKGPPWQIAKYGFLLDKPSADIDLLIDSDKYGVVKRILNRGGYHLRWSGWVRKEFYRGLHPKVSEMTYVKKILGTKLTIDLHLQAVREALTAWYKEPITHKNMSLLTSYLLDQRRREGGWSVLPDTDNLLYLCLNLMIHHAGRGIYQLANIAHLIEGGKIDWDKFEGLARRHRVENYVYFPLLWSGRLFKVKVPILSRVEPSKARLWMAKMVINRWTIMRSIPVSKWFWGKLNLLVIGYLRLVLSGLL